MSVRNGYKGKRARVKTKKKYSNKNATMNIIA